MKVTKHRQKTAHWIITGILLLAAALRMLAFEEALVGADQSSILSAAAEIAALRDFPMVGMKSSIGVMQTAITPYVAAIPLLLVHKVSAIKWFFSALDLLALALLYRAVKKAFGQRAALVTAQLYASNPWIIEFVRWIWYQSLIPTFATIAFAAFLLILSSDSHKGRGWLVLGLFSSTLMGMVHLAAVPWAALLFLLGLLIAWQRKWWKAYALGLAVSLVAAGPYLYYLYVTGFADIALILNGGQSTDPALNWSTYRLSLELLSGAGVLATPRDPLWSESVFQAPLLYLIVPGALSLALLSSLWKLRRKPHAQLPLIFSLVWTVLAPTLFLPLSFHLQHFYLLFLFPAPFVLIGAWLGAPNPQAAPSRRKRILQTLAQVLLVLLCLWWTHLWSVRINFESQGQLRAPTRAWLMDYTTDVLSTYLEREPQGEVIILTPDAIDGLTPYDWMRNFVHSDRIRVVSITEGFIIPAPTTCYMLADATPLSALAPIEEIATEHPEMHIPATPPWKFYCIPERAPLPQSAAKWENGLSLLSVVSEGTFAPREELHITYTWHYSASAAKEYHFFNHLMINDTLIAQTDGAGVPTWYWRSNDVLITRFTLHLPETLAPGTYRLLTGSYTWPAIERVFLVDGEAAHTAAEWTYP